MKLNFILMIIAFSFALVGFNSNIAQDSGTPSYVDPDLYKIHDGTGNIYFTGNLGFI